MKTYTDNKINFYGYNTGNNHRVALALEESGLAYRSIRVKLSKGEHKRSDFLALNPRGTVPVIVDPTGPEGRKVTLSQTLSILLYIAEKSGTLIPTDPLAKIQCHEWLSFIFTDVASASMQGFYIGVLAKEKHTDAADILMQRAVNFLHFANERLGVVPYLAGHEFSLADIVAYPSALLLSSKEGAEEYNHIKRWMASLHNRPAFKRALDCLANPTG